MKTKIPKKLRKAPLVEALWEVRFSKSRGPVVELLPGLLFKAFSNKYPNTVRLPSSWLPEPVIKVDPKFQFMPKVRLEGDRQAIQIGEQILSLSCRRPYPGWESFSQDIKALIKVVKETELITQLDRFSLKYINIIELNPPLGVEGLNFELRIGKGDSLIYSTFSSSTFKRSKNFSKRSSFRWL